MEKVNGNLVPKRTTPENRKLERADLNQKPREKKTQRKCR